MNTRRIKFDLLAFLESLQESNFKISSLTKQYLKSPNCPHNNERSARQYLYRNIEFLTAKGTLIKTGSSKDKTIRYSLVRTSNTNAPEKSDEIDSYDAKLDTTQQKLRDKLKEYKLELLSSIGEAEAYKEISEEHPSLLRDIQPKYHMARDNSSKLLGKVNAIETIIKDVQNFVNL